MADLATLGVEEAKYSSLLYPRIQEIAAAANFMGFDGIISPSARFGGIIRYLVWAIGRHPHLLLNMRLFPEALPC